MASKQHILTKGRHKVTLVPSCDFVEVLSSDGGVYYSRKLPTQWDCFEMNILHPDIYTFSSFCDIEEIGDVSTSGDSIKMCLPERFRYKPFVIKRVNNIGHTPARINTLATPAVIEVGDKFYTLPKQVRLFVLLHELGHMFYKTEWKVDRFALKAFLAAGGNKSQAIIALTRILKDNPQNRDRISKLFNTINGDYDSPDNK
jgi:hypothetical protein